MLVLSRQAGESVQVGGNIEITVLEVRGAIVRIGIAAPRDVSIYRSELGQINQQATSDWRKKDRLEGIARELRRTKPGS